MAITLFTSCSCTSCRKSKLWLDQHEIPYTERNILTDPLKMKELKEILRMTEEGTDEILSTRSKQFQELDVNLEELHLHELLELIQDKPGLLRCPIIMDEKRFQVGFNEDEIRKFLPRSIRAYLLKLLEAKTMLPN
ncbi:MULTISPECIES: transcriptional regulator SpxA [Bacillaceae]|uniref:transcriptional regulator SpxA n=1 Tax=Bacillaceae TaxID=186817 RepID=UPI000C76E038|nr:MULTISPECIES: transcriptional regulator SpxA [Bacillaceae]PLR66226.1 transcriptional regulator Spx [Bacillus sp. UMB0893]QNG58263.1 transcriptional regulator Spx [Bacillus sp. PAMC26568]